MSTKEGLYAVQHIVILCRIGLHKSFLRLIMPSPTHLSTTLKYVISEWTVDVCMVAIVCVALSVTTVNGGALHDAFAERQVPQLPSGMSGSSDSETLPVADDNLCRNVCQFCLNVLGLRWAALCNVQCFLGGREYGACMTIWSYRDELYRIGY